MRDIPTLDNSGFLATLIPVQSSLAADDGGGGGPPQLSNLYLQPDGISLYLQPDGISLYLQPE